MNENPSLFKSHPPLHAGWRSEHMAPGFQVSPNPKSAFGLVPPFWTSKNGRRVNGPWLSAMHLHGRVVCTST